MTQQEIPRILWNLKVLCHSYMCLPPVFLYQFHSLFWAYHSWGIKQGLGIVTCNTGDLTVIGLVCVFLEVFLSAVYFRVTCCPTFRACSPIMQVSYVLATCLSLPVPFFILGKAQLGHKTRPGHCNMQHW